MTKSLPLQGSQAALASPLVPGDAVLPLQIKTLKDGRQLQIDALEDCSALDDAFLRMWCEEMTKDVRSDLPLADAKAEDAPKFLAAFSRALLSGSDAVCDEPAVARWVAISAHVADGATFCRQSLETLKKQGFFSVSDPANGETIEIALP